MKKTACIFILIIFICVTACATEPWKELKGDHFIVFYKTDEIFAKEISKNAEVYYNRVADELGYPRYSNFWQWDNRVKIYLYASHEEFQQATGKPGWTHGVANYTEKEIYSYNRHEHFLEGLLPHEITHLIFRDFVGFKGEIALWMDEGVAQWQEPKKRAEAQLYARYLVQTTKNIPLAILTGMDVRGTTDEEVVHRFYMQSVSLVDFLVKTYGPRSFTDFCRQLRDGKLLEEALRYAYSIQSVSELEDKWKKYAMAVNIQFTEEEKGGDDENAKDDKAE